LGEGSSQTLWGSPWGGLGVGEGSWALDWVLGRVYPKFLPLLFQAGLGGSPLGEAC